MYGIVYWTGYSCKNKRQNALFWARKLKKNFCRGGTAPPQPHPLPKPHSLGACSASPHICQPPSYFFTILTLAKSNNPRRSYSGLDMRSAVLELTGSGFVQFCRWAPGGACGSCGDWRFIQNVPEGASSTHVWNRCAGVFRVWWSRWFYRRSLQNNQVHCKYVSVQNDPGQNAQSLMCHHFAIDPRMRFAPKCSA